jgi:hypothetical protein
MKAFTAAIVNAEILYAVGTEYENVSSAVKRFRNRTCLRYVHPKRGHHAYYCVSDLYQCRSFPRSRLRLSRKIREASGNKMPAGISVDE